jgi:hypothetical protein
MGAGVLGYRLLSVADRARVLAGGLRLLVMKRRGDARLAALTVDGVLDLLGQSVAARRAFWHPVAIATLNDDPAIASADLLAEVMVRAFFAGKDAAALRALQGRSLGALHGRRPPLHRGARRPHRDQGPRRRRRFPRRRGEPLRAPRRASSHRVRLRERRAAAGLFPLLPVAVGAACRARRHRGAHQLAHRVGARVARPADPRGAAVRRLRRHRTHWAFNRDVISGAAIATAAICRS